MSKLDEVLASTARRAKELATKLTKSVLSFVLGHRTAGRDAVRPILQEGFDDQYLDVFADALSKVSGESITAKDASSYKVGGVALSQQLYNHADQTAAAVATILDEHVKYGHNAQALALDLYDGYGPGEEILDPKVRLPKYIDDAALNRDMDALMARIQANTIKTPALRQAYLDALDAIIADKGDKAIGKALDVAVKERYRYFANRIAQTELARVQNQKTAREIMDDPNVEVVRYRISASHPKPDICDCFGNTDRYGLGAGLYPKAKAPLAPCHPFCRCTCTPVRGVSARNAVDDPTAFQRYVANLDPATARQVAGSKSKRDAVLGGADLLDVVNAGRPDEYQIKFLNDA